MSSRVMTCTASGTSAKAWVRRLAETISTRINSSSDKSAKAPASPWARATLGQAASSAAVAMNVRYQVLGASGVIRGDCNVESF